MIRRREGICRPTRWGSWTGRRSMGMRGRTRGWVDPRGENAGVLALCFTPQGAIVCGGGLALAALYLYLQWDDVCQSLVPALTKPDGAVFSEKAPGQPTEGDGYKPPKRWDGKKVRSPNGKDYGYPDKDGNVWIPIGTGGEAHGGPHWDVQKPGGGYMNVFPPK